MCTYFTLNTPNQQPPYIAARSTENGTRFHSKMMFKMKTHVYCQKLPDSLTGGPTDQQPQWVGQLSQWMGKYAFVGMNDCPFPTLNTDDIAAHGMNTAGLVAGALTLIESEYQDPATIATTDTVILFPYLVNWLLSNFATCEEIKNALNGSVKIINPDPEYTEQNKAILLHFPVSDATGQSIVIEVLNGQIKVSNNNRYGVLTNDPCFEWQTTNMSNYLCLTPDNAPSQDGNYFSGQSPSQGTGLVAIPGSFTPRDRFVRVATMKNWAKPVATAEEVTNLAFHILNTVDIPLGVINAGGTDQDYTQWTIVADMTNLIFYVRMYDSPQVHSIDLNSLDFDNLDGKLYTVPTSSIATMISVDKIALGKIEVS